MQIKEAIVFASEYPYLFSNFYAVIYDILCPF